MKQLLSIAGLLALSTLFATGQGFYVQLATPAMSDALGSPCLLQRPNCPPYTPAQYGSIKYPDLDGDGFPDICYMDAAGIQCAIYIRSNGTFGTFNRWTDAFTLSKVSSASYWETIQYGDVDGDGKDDLCGRQKYGFFCYFSNGVTFVDKQTFASAFSDDNHWGDNPAYWETIRLVDVNGDRKKDVCGRWITGIVCSLVDTSGRNPIFLSFSHWSDAFSDVHGWNADPSYWSTIQYADLNRDGLPDVCGRSGAGMWCEFNYGSKFDGGAVVEIAFSDANGWNAPQYYSTIRLADINGDGKADVCGRGTAGVYCGIFVSPHRGSAAGVNWGFLGTGGAPVVTRFSDANGWNQPFRYLNMWISDIDGTGRGAICGRDSGGIVCARSDSTSTAHFQAIESWVSGFSDYQEGLSFGFPIDRRTVPDLLARAASYWSTLQPVLNRFCGRTSLGITCSTFNSPFSMF